MNKRFAASRINRAHISASSFLPFQLTIAIITRISKMKIITVRNYEKWFRNMLNASCAICSASGIAGGRINRLSKLRCISRARVEKNEKLILIIGYSLTC